MIASRLDRRRYIPVPPFSMTINTALFPSDLSQTNTHTFSLQGGTLTEVDWGDGTVNTATSHTYAGVGTYTITIQGSAAWRISYFWSGRASSSQITTIHTWGDTMGNSTFDYAENLTTIESGVLSPYNTGLGNQFQECTSLNNLPVFTSTTVNSCNATFKGCTALTSMPIPDFPNCWSYSETWSGCTGMTSWPSGWDMTNVTSLSNAWFNCFDVAAEVVMPANNTTGNVTNWDGLNWCNAKEFGSHNFQGVTNLMYAGQSGTQDGIFYQAKFDIIRSQDFSTVTDMRWGFREAVASVIEAWIPHTGPSVDMAWCFYGCANLLVADLPDLSNVVDFTSTWQKCSSLTTFPSITVSQVTRLNQTWSECTNITSFATIDTSTITEMATAQQSPGYGLSYGPYTGTFEQCTSLTSWPDWDYSNVTEFRRTFAWCSGLNTEPPVLFTANTTKAAYTFFYCTTMPTLPMMVTSNITDFSYCFYNCDALTSIPHFDTSSATNMEGFLYSCGLITTLPLFDTSSNINFNSMFANLPITTMPLFNTSLGQTFESFCSGCPNLTELPLIDTSNATNLDFMVRFNTSMTSFPALNTANVTSFWYTFQDCTGLTSFPALDYSSAQNMERAYSGCTGLNNFDFPVHAYPNVTTFVNCWAGVKISTQSCTDLLIAIEAGNANSNVNLNLGTANYYTAQAGTARSDLQARGWTVTTGAGV